MRTYVDDGLEATCKHLDKRREIAIFAQPVWPEFDDNRRTCLDYILSAAKNSILMSLGVNPDQRKLIEAYAERADDLIKHLGSNDMVTDTMPLHNFPGAGVILSYLKRHLSRRVGERGLYNLTRAR